MSVDVDYLLAHSSLHIWWRKHNFYYDTGPGVVIYGTLTGATFTQHEQKNGGKACPPWPPKSATEMYITAIQQRP